MISRFCHMRIRGDYFEYAFPDPKEVFRANPDATVADFIDVDKVILPVRRFLSTWDILIQPDVRRITRNLGLHKIRPYVNLSKKDALQKTVELRTAMRSALDSMRQYPKIAEEYAVPILWGTHHVLTRNPRADVDRSAPIYIEKRFRPGTGLL